MQERRQARRFNSSLYVIWDLTTQSVASGQTLNFSATGCFIRSRNGLPTKPALSIRLRLPTERWMEIRGAVVRAGMENGFGVSFTELSDEDRAMIGLLEEYEQASYADA
jgi:c-di-GMP-binding flagellar brake protein YcgR